ncbi:histidine kinase dimerization/phospho-acceptor domain-containing protein [Candidatus Uabimicrobium sp. HlEnr_7]|uniref:histidine kinase dimerization/phospho-acceptor domain-containing protein n=1 Tax=Candidatus Uabimicrobium helgolandensis TaxID=3095367 RepID=UPI003555D4E4
MSTPPIQILISTGAQHLLKPIKQIFPNAKKTQEKSWKKILNKNADIFIFIEKEFCQNVDKSQNRLGIASFIIDEDIEFLSALSTAEKIINKLLYKKRIYEHITRKDMSKHITYLQEKAAIANVSLDLIHEMNNPLQVMLGFVESTLEIISKKEEFYEDVKIIEEEVHKCISIVKHVRSFHDGSQETMYRNVSFVLESVKQMIDLRLRKKRISLHIDMPNEVLLLENEAYKLSMILLCTFLNLLDICKENQKATLQIIKISQLEIIITLGVDSAFQKEIFSYLHKYLQQKSVEFSHTIQNQLLTCKLIFEIGK